MTNTMPKTVEVTDEWLRRIKVWRLGNGGGRGREGFQRKLSENKVSEIIDAVKKGRRTIPPIMVAKVGDEYICYDGQHRLEARQKLVFPLFAQVDSFTRDEAARNFVTINAKGAKVGLRHRLSVDPDKFASNVRRIAKNYRADVTQVYNLLMGISGNRIRRGGEISNEELRLASKILQHWTKDKRWSGQLARGKGNLYNKPGTLKLIGSICKERPSDIARTINGLRLVDFKRTSPYGRKFGSGNSDQMAMRDYVMRFMFRNK
jgi:hypothetical protein